MPHYRFYPIRNGGKRKPGRDLICSDDAGAAALAESMIPGNEAVEVWSGPRMVSRTSTSALKQENA